MNHTQNYQLNQWEADDPVLHTDFNADNAKIDGALGDLATKADTLQQTVTHMKGRFYSSSYLGNGSTSGNHEIQFPRQIAFMMISGETDCLFTIPASGVAWYLDSTTGKFSTVEFSMPVLNARWSKAYCNRINVTYRMFAVFVS